MTLFASLKKINALLVLCIVFLNISAMGQSAQTKNIDEMLGTPKKILTVNPYQNVLWGEFHAFKANFHTHTQVSDGVYMPHEAVDLYHQANYEILSLTDHVPDWDGNNVGNINTWPWNGFAYLTSVTQWSAAWENRCPDSLGMLAVQGSEPSEGHHRGSFFNPLSDPFDDLHFTFQAIEQLNGLAMLYHPGRYWSIDSVYAPTDMYSLNWYENFFTAYDVLIGLEVYNQGDKFPYDRVLWDELLTMMMPQRPIWGYSNDDMHWGPQLFKNFNFMLMDTLTEGALRKSMIDGAFYFCYEPYGDGQEQIPIIDSIIVDRINHDITIYASNYDTILWISGIDGTGSSRTSKVIDSGSVFSWADFSNPYVRAVLINADGRTYTQPFGFDIKVPEKADTIFGPVDICQGTDTVVFQVTKDIFTEKYHWLLPAGAGFIGDSTSYSISVNFANVISNDHIGVYKSNISGISDTTFFSFNIITPPSAGILTGNDTICAGDSAAALLLNGHNADISGWESSSDFTQWDFIPHNDSVFHTGTLFNDTYFRALIKKDGCPTVYSDTVFIKTYDVPQKPVIMVVGNALVSSSPTGNQWYSQNGPIPGATNHYFVPDEDGTYYVIVTLNNCSSEPSLEYDYCHTEIENPATSDEILLYPNPTDGMVTINFGPLNAKVQIDIYSGEGKLVKTAFAQASAIRQDIAMNLSFLKDGLYVLKIHNGDINITERLLIIK